jgi:capsular exopolysaccharide synthesis family protein
MKIVEQHEMEDELNIKQILSSLWHYRKSILFMTFFATLIAAYIAYFKPSIYTAKMLVKITSDRQGYYEDFLMVSPASGHNEIEDELIVFQSRPIAQKVLEKLNLGIRYYTTKRLRSVELYKEAPFTVTYTHIDSKMYGKKFHVTPVDNEHFRLDIEENRGTLQSIKEWIGLSEKAFKYREIHMYNTPIETEWFSLEVHKIYEPPKKEFWFTIVPNDAMVGFIQGGISASTVSKFGTIVSLNFSDTVPQRAAEIINGVAESYIEQNLEMKSKGAKKQLYFIDMQLEAINQTLKGSAKKLQEYKATNIVVNLSDKAQMTASKLSAYESKLYGINMQLDIVENMLSHLNAQKSMVHFTIDASYNENPLIAKLLTKIQETMTKYASMSATYTENYPGIKKLKTELVFLKQSLKEALKNYMVTLKKQKNRMLQAISQQQHQLKDVPKQEQHLEQLSRHFMVNEKIYSYLLEKRAETAILASSTISNTSIVQKALPPAASVKPKRKLIVLIGLILGFILGVMQAMIRAFFDNTIKRNEDIEMLTQIPLYGTLPLVDTKERIPAYLEAIRSLWINLAFSKVKDTCNIISATSTISGEGKTFTVYHLAKMIVKSSDYKVIVLDMDLRKATLHEKFGIENREKGISTVLNERYSLQESIQSTTQQNLDILLSGPKAPNPTRLIMSENFEAMLEELSVSYDYILIDTPPIGLVSDAMKMIHISDMVLFLVKAEYSKKEFIQNMNKLERDEDLNFGIVLNGVDYEKSYYYYDYKHHYMNSYYHTDEHTL